MKSEKVLHELRSFLVHVIKYTFTSIQWMSVLHRVSSSLLPPLSSKLLLVFPRKMVAGLACECRQESIQKPSTKN